MKKLTWQDITVQQFIDLQRLAKNKTCDDFEKVEKSICIICDMTEKQVEELTLQEFNQYAKACADVMNEKMPAGVKPKKVIKAGRNSYEVEYNPKNLMHRQYVEIQYFSKDIFENIHLIMASIVKPIGRFGRRLKNEAESHQQYANDFLEAKIVDVYYSCVFFCKLYLNSMEHIKAYLIHEMMTKGASKEQAETLINTSQNAMAGSITQERWLLLNA